MQSGGCHFASIVAFVAAQSMDALDQPRGVVELLVSELYRAIVQRRATSAIPAEILGIEDQLAFDDGRKGPVWRKRAETALKKKRRQRPGLQQRIGELRRAEKRAAQLEPVTSRKDAKRKAFVDAAEELLTPEVFTEVWARAAERMPVAFAEVGGSEV